MPVTKLEDFEQIDLNEGGIAVLFDAVPGTIIRAPLSGEIYDVRDDERDVADGVDPEDCRKTVEVLSLDESGDPSGIRVFNIIDGLDPASVPLKGTQVKRGNLIGRAGAGDAGDWDQTWRAFINMPGEDDGEGRDINPIKLAKTMGMIQYPEAAKTSKLLPEFQGSTANVPAPDKSEPVFEPVFEAPQPKSNKKVVLLAIGAIAAWKLFGKKGK
jgi:hypothetical protein